ncbi:hypothetical protein BKA56DRAFT_589188 [Ilyonectria sp. MPI-CAGE-AT-0026]|nr:hypothetical protein BKA56DRAFT_589188 [Ilyonectria sp. MPI-CAGE-AT-0026]
MPQSRFLWRGPRLPCLSPSPPSTALPLQLPILDPPIRHRPAVGQRRCLASHATTQFTTASSSSPSSGLQSGSLSISHLFPRFPDSQLFEGETKPPDRLTDLDLLLRAIQCRDVPQIVPALLAWTQRLSNNDGSVSHAAQIELQNLPIATFSEILRWIDPVANPAHDVAHGLNISLGQTQFTDATRLVDDFGVRVRHREVLEAVKILMEARHASGVRMLIPDYEVFIRCAAAASDSPAAVEFFGAINKHGLGSQRNTSTWTEFTKALFVTEPLYYQFDRSRVAVLPRQTYSNRQPMAPEKLWKLERMRHSINAMRHLPFNRNPARPAQDLRMLTRQKSRVRQHWIRSKLYGVLLNEELLCATMISFARSSSLTSIKGVILQRGFRISLKEDQDTGESVVTKGKMFRDGNPREPTERLLSAIVETFGSISRVRAALDLLVYISQRYHISIPHETWSNLLNWAYVCASKPFQRMRGHQGPYSVNDVKAKDVIEIWRIMTSEPFNVKPTFDDYSVYIKALIVQRSFRLAVDVIRNEAVPYYRQLEEEHYNIAVDEILKDESFRSHRRLQIETHKEYVWYHISSWFAALLQSASAGRNQREGRFMQVVVPDLIEEFSDFFHDQISYRSAQGRVRLTRSTENRRFDYQLKMRTTLPQDLGGMEVKALQNRGEVDIEAPDFDWPQAVQMEILDWKRKPRSRRMHNLPAPQSTSVSAKRWWKNIEQDLRI